MWAARNSARASRCSVGRYHVASTTRTPGSPSRSASHAALTTGPKLDSLTASGSQIVLASDRPPADINGLDARLVSRFSGGLIVDIAAPEYETRVAIIRKKANEQGSLLLPGVAEAPNTARLRALPVQRELEPVEE